MNEGSYAGWITPEYNKSIIKAAELDVARITADEQAADILADAAWDAGFVYGVEAQKHGLAEA